jgi:hypothetical protein
MWLDKNTHRWRSEMTDARLNLFDGITLSIANSTHHQHPILALSPTQFWE